MKYVNHDEAMNFFVTQCAKEGIFSAEAIEQKAAEIVEQIPPATKGMYAPAEAQDDNFILAANYWDIYKGISGNASNPANTAVTTAVPNVPTKPASYTVMPTLNDEQRAAVQRALSANIEQKAMKTANTKIRAILVRSPKASELLSGKQVVPECDAEKLQEYEKHLVDTPENRNNFKLVKEAVNSKTPLPVYINDKSRKYMGAIVQTPEYSEGKSEMKELIMDDATLTTFVAVDLLCRIPSQDTGLGCILTGFKEAKAGKVADLTQSQGKANLKWTGKSEAIRNGDPNIVISINEKRGKEVKEQKLRIATGFEVYVTSTDASGNVTYKTNNKGERLTKIVRLTGVCKEVPVLKRKAEFVNIFGEEKNGNTIYATMTHKEKQEAIRTALMFVDRASASGDIAANNATLQSILEMTKGKGASEKVQAFVE